MGWGKCISERPGLDFRGPPSAELDFEPVRHLASDEDLAGYDLKAIFRDQPRDRRTNLRGDSVTVYVPPRPRMAKETALLIDVEALPNRMAIWPQAIDGSAPPYF